MKIIILGSVSFTKEIIKSLIKKNIYIDGIIGKKYSKFNSDYSDVVKFFKKETDVLYSKDVNDKKTYNWIKNKKPDLIVCLGWSHIIGPKILKLPKIGIIGYHPSNLPSNKGRHPIIWSIVLGLKQTASTFFLMNSEVDGGKIISKKLIKIKKYYSSMDLYKKLYKVAGIQLCEILNKLKNGKLRVVKQKKINENYWRKRKFEDGQMDWRMNAENILRLIKGLGKPYLGAHFMFNKKEVKIWRAKVIKSKKINLEPGKIINIKNSYPIIKCGKNSLMLLEYTPKIKLKLDSYL